MRVSLTHPSKMAVWRSAEPPVDLPPVYARPLVQWWAGKVDARGDGDREGAHALCGAGECNYRYASGNFVQRTHGKIRYEGMALSRVTDDTAERYRALGAELVALYEYNCTGGLHGTQDSALAPANWTTTSNATCALATASPSAWVLSARVGPAESSLAMLSLWHKPGDHYVVGSAEGRADAIARGYAKMLDLGWVWPPPGSANASARYGLPCVSKDDPTYISQDYWRGRIWSPMIQLVYWGLAQYSSPEVKAATDGLVEQSKALLLRGWFGYESRNDYAGAGRRVYENFDADTAEGYSYSSSAFPLYGWGALAGFVGLVHNGFYEPLTAVVNATAMHASVL